MKLNTPKIRYLLIFYSKLVSRRYSCSRIKRAYLQQKRWNAKQCKERVQNELHEWHLVVLRSKTRVDGRSLPTKLDTNNDANNIWSGASRGETRRKRGKGEHLSSTIERVCSTNLPSPLNARNIHHFANCSDRSIFRRLVFHSFWHFGHTMQRFELSLPINDCLNRCTVP